MLSSLFPRVVRVKNLGFGLDVAYRLQRLQGMMRLKQSVESNGLTITRALHTNFEDTGMSLYLPAPQQSTNRVTITNCCKDQTENSAETMAA